jgi:hypothetical protein
MLAKAWLGAVVFLFALPGAEAQGPPRAPIDKLGVVLDGFHLHDGAPGEQMEAIHYCSEVNPELIQCVLFDGTGEGARMIGIEYVISERMLSQLPEEERALWHSHGYEVKSGMLHAFGLSQEEELALVKRLAGTYGKTWHTWQTDQGQELPTGRPDLMMSFTRDGQARPELLSRRDKALGLSTEELKRQREGLEAPKPLSGVDKGEKGRSCPEPRQAKHGR